MQLSKIKTIAYWFTTGLLGFDLLAGGAVSFAHPRQTLSLLQHLGYPAYLASILGFWKLLGGIALLLPGMPVLKEWAYAGICSDWTSAAVCLAASGDGAPQLAPPLVFAALATASYLLRPRTPARQVLRFGEAFASTAAERTSVREQRSAAKTKPKPEIAGRARCLRFR